jgi:nucleoside permease NupC
LLLVKELSVISPSLLLKLLLPQETRPKTKKPKQNKAKQKKFIKIINSQAAACTHF